MPTQSDVPPAMWDEYSGGDLLAVAVAFIVLSTFFVGLRFFARVYLRDMKMGWDDYFIIPGYIAELLMCAGAIGKFFSEVSIVGAAKSSSPHKVWQCRVALF